MPPILAHLTEPPLLAPTSRLHPTPDTVLKQTCVGKTLIGQGYFPIDNELAAHDNRREVGSVPSSQSSDNGLTGSWRKEQS